MAKHSRDSAAIVATSGDEVIYEAETQLIQDILGDVLKQQMTNEANEDTFKVPKIVDIVAGEGCNSMTTSGSVINNQQSTAVETKALCNNNVVQFQKSNLQQVLPLQNIIITYDGKPFLLSGSQVQVVSNSVASTTGINTNALGWSFPTTATTATPSSSSLPLLISPSYQVVNNVANSTQKRTVSTATSSSQCHVTKQIEENETSNKTKKESTDLGKKGEIKYTDENKVTAAAKRANCDTQVKQDRSPLPTKNPVIAVPTSDDASVTLRKFYFSEGLCRICLLEKPHTSSIFKDVAVDDKGMVENVRGPHSSRFNLIAAIKIILDIDVVYGDGLPDQICVECWDQIISFSAFRRQISVGQFKLNEIESQVKSSTNPTFIPAIGEQDHLSSDIFRYPESILQAKSMLQKSKFSHLVQRCLSDRAWDMIFTRLSLTLGIKSSKFECLEQYIYSPPCVSGWFCNVCQCIIHGCKEDFQTHFQNEHSDENILVEEIQFPCDICGCYFPTSDKCTLTQNYRNHWLQHFFFHECLICSKRFPSVKSLSCHKKNLHNDDKKCHQCDACGKSFKTKGSLDSHKKTHLDPAERKTNYCEICKKSLSISLGQHMQTTHSDKRPWKCETCGKCFKRREDIVSHIDTVHLKLRKFKCELCEETFKSYGAKMTHVRRHKGEKPFVCKVCDKSFITQQSLRSHEIKHQEVGNIKCEVCEKVFKRKVYLAEHMKIHTNEKPHECPICGKCIRMKSNYFKHLNVHKRHEKEGKQ